jgi:hypothetical protein
MLKHRHFKQTETPDPGRVSLVGAWAVRISGIVSGDFTRW